MHHHAGKQSAALLVLRKIEVIDLETKLNGNVFQLPIFLQFVPIIIRTSLQRDDMRGIQN